MAQQKKTCPNSQGTRMLDIPQNLMTRFRVFPHRLFQFPGLKSILLTAIFGVSAAALASEIDSGSGSNSGSASEEGWIRFRGPNGSGITKDSAERIFPADLGASGSLQWKVAAPPGHSSPIVVGDMIFITGNEPGKLLTLCYDRRSGALRWKQEVAVTVLENVYTHGPSTPTPVSDGKHLFSVFGSFGILAYDLEGRELWRQEREVQKNLYGSASSPIILDDKLIVFSGNETVSLLQAIEPATGKVLWERKRGGPASSWSTPVLLQSAQEPALLIYEPTFLRAVSLNDGTDIWLVPHLAEEPVTTPQQLGDLIFTTATDKPEDMTLGVLTFEALLAECDANGDGGIDAIEAGKNRSVVADAEADSKGNYPLRLFMRMLDADKSGTISSTEWPAMQQWANSWNDDFYGLIALRVGADGLSSPAFAWSHPSGAPECPSPIVVADKVYMVRNGGIVTCVDARDGSLVYKERLGGGGNFYASPVSAADKIYLASQKGLVTVLAAHGEPKAVSSYDFSEPIWATPALSDGQIIIRGEKSLAVFAQPK